MEALSELCDLIAQNPTLLSSNLSWLCSRCPPSRPHSLTRSHLHTITSLARLLSKSPSLSPARSALLSFLPSLSPLAFRPPFWPPSFPLQSISLFFSDLLRYLSIASDLSPDFRSDLSLLFGEIVVYAIHCVGEEREIARVFLLAVAENCPAISGEDAERVLGCLVMWIVGEENSKGKAVENSSEIEISGFWGEDVEGLERMEMGFRLVGRVLDRAGGVKGEQLGVFCDVAAKQMKSLPGFLKVVA